MKRNLLLRLRYDGTNYHGWQIQKNKVTVQGTVKKAIKKLTGEDVTVYGCSRTDAGVHARAFVMNFTSECTIPLEKVPVAINSCLPDDISCYAAEEREEDFHARFSCKGKEYLYRVHNSEYRDPLYYKRAYHYNYPMSLEKMQAASAVIRGERDWKSFQASGSPVNSTVREVFYVKVEKNGEFFDIRVSGDGFLYNMVRIIVGTLLLAGRGKWTPEDVKRIIESCDRRKSGPTVPAHGLYLNEVYYTDEDIAKARMRANEEVQKGGGSLEKTD